VEDNSNKECSEYDEILEDGNDVKNAENEKSPEDIWSTDFAVSKELFCCCFFKFRNIVSMYLNYDVWKNISICYTFFSLLLQDAKTMDEMLSQLNVEKLVIEVS